MTADLLNDRFDLSGQFQAFSGQNCLVASHRLVKLSRCEGVAALLAVAGFDVAKDLSARDAFDFSGIHFIVPPLSFSQPEI